MELTREEIKERYERLLKEEFELYDSGIGVSVAEKDGDFYVWYRTGNEWDESVVLLDFKIDRYGKADLTTFQIPKERRREGHGTKLLEVTEKLIKELGVRKARVVPSGEGLAFRFWEKRGYHGAGVLKEKEL